MHAKMRENPGYQNINFVGESVRFAEPYKTVT